MHIQIKGF